MTSAPKPARDLIPAGENLPSTLQTQLPGIVARAGKAAAFAAEEFFYGRIRNEHTRRAYFTAVKRFLAAMEERGLCSTDLRTSPPSPHYPFRLGTDDTLDTRTPALAR